MHCGLKGSDNVYLVYDYLVLSQIMIHYTLQIQTQVPEIIRWIFIECYVWKFASFSANFVQNSKKKPQISYINVVAKQNLFLLLTSDFLRGHYGQYSTTETKNDITLGPEKNWNCQ